MEALTEAGGLQERRHRRSDAQGLRRLPVTQASRRRRGSARTPHPVPCSPGDDKEEDAKANRYRELKGGADFAELRQEEVDRARRGREWRRSRLTSPRSRWCRNSPTPPSRLSKGKVSDPVKSQFGWHVIKIEDKRKKPIPPFEQVKRRCEPFVVRKAQSDLVTKLRGSAKIERTRSTPPSGSCGSTPATHRRRCALKKK